MDKLDGIKKWMEYEENIENPGIPMIRVIGEDRLQHIAEPHKDTCLCGMKIFSKKIPNTKDTLYSCYECTF